MDAYVHTPTLKWGMHNQETVSLPHDLCWSGRQLMYKYSYWVIWFITRGDDRGLGSIHPQVTSTKRMDDAYYPELEEWEDWKKWECDMGFQREGGVAVGFLSYPRKCN